MNVLQLLEATKQNQAAGLNHTISLHLKHLAGERNRNFIENAIRTFDLKKKRRHTREMSLPVFKSKTL